MIRVTCMGHIRTSLGMDEVEVAGEGFSASQLIEKLREMGQKDPNLGFTKYNTLVIVNGSSAFTCGAEDRILRDGDEVLLLPFSHGG